MLFFSGLGEIYAGQADHGGIHMGDALVFLGGNAVVFFELLYKVAFGGKTDLGGDAVRLAAAEINQAVFPQKLCLAVVFVDKAALNDQGKFIKILVPVQRRGDRRVQVGVIGVGNIVMMGKIVSLTTHKITSKRVIFHRKSGNMLPV